MDVKERPILFSGEMVRAILDGRKTQTRRVVKPQPTIDPVDPEMSESMGWDLHDPWHLQYTACGRNTKDFVCPYGKPGDRLWVRESWSPAEPGPIREGMAIAYKQDFAGVSDGVVRKWKPSIHMPRWASRITLEITAIRCERLQEISEADAYAEGVTIPNHQYFASNGNPELRNESRCAYRNLWERINGPESCPWVWVVEFKRIGQ